MQRLLAIGSLPCVCFWLMRGIAKWVAILFIAVVAISPILEVFDKTDGIAQDASDLARYALFVFCFLVFALRRTIITLRWISIRTSVIRLSNLCALDGPFVSLLNPRIPDRALFLTLHDLRI